MIKSEVKKLEEDYKDFMHIDSFPPYTFESKTVSLVKADSEGFDSVAQSKYNPETQEHTLIVADNLIIEPYILFHEFTHILDAETYARGDKVKYATSSGFTEYHASQIELLKMLGANSANEHISFSTKAMYRLQRFLFWASKDNEAGNQAEKSFFDLFGFSDAEVDDPNAKIEQVRKVFKAIYSGELNTSLDDKFYA